MVDSVAERVDDVRNACLQIERDDVAVVLSSISDVTARRGIQKSVGHIEAGSVLLDLRLVASEIATLDTLDTEWATQRTRRSRNSDRVAQRV